MLANRWPESEECARRLNAGYSAREIGGRSTPSPDVNFSWRQDSLARLSFQLLVASKTQVRTRNSKIELQSELDNSRVVARRDDATKIARI